MSVDYLLLENGDFLQLEDGSGNILLESSDPEVISSSFGPLVIYIDNGSGPVNYTKYVVSLSIEDNINLPTVADITVANIDTSFIIPVRNAYVQVYSTKNSLYLATGFITSSPQERNLGGAAHDPVRRFHQFEYDIAVTSDEWLLNIKSLPFQPAMMNQTMGSIIRTLTNALVPTGFYDTTNVDEGDIVPIFVYDPRQKWSEIVKGFADGLRYRYKVINKKIYFKPYGDSFLGVNYNDTAPMVTDRPWYFDPYALNTQLLNVQPVNDVIVTGQVEGRNIRDDYFIGDGVSGNFPLRHKLFKGATSLLLKEDWTSDTFAADLWNVLDTGPFFVLTGALNVQGGTGTLGGTYIQGKNGVELAGQILLEHGEITFNNTCTGIIGGIWANTPFSTATNCLFGFDVRPTVGGVVVTASGASGMQITPMINGVLAATGVQVRVNRHYFLQTLITSKRPSRYNKVYRSLAGVEYGGDELAAPVHATFITTEIDLANPMNPTVYKHEVDTDPQSFGLYLPLNVNNMNLTMSSTTIAQPPQVTLDVKSLRGPTGTQLPILPTAIGPEQSYLVGFGTLNQTATMSQAGDSELLQFYFPDTIPAVGARVRLQSWEAMHSVARVQDPVSILAEGVVTGDDGVRAATITDLNPLPRTSEECDLAATVVIQDRNRKQYNGSYSFIDDYLVVTAPGATGTFDYPRTGRYLNITASDRGITNENFIVRKVKWEVIELFQEKIQFTLEFGQDQYLNKLINRFIPQQNDVLTSMDTSQRPDIQDIGDVGAFYLADMIKVRATDITGTAVTVVVSDTFPSVSGAQGTGIQISGAQIEVRRIDTGWGDNNQNRIGVFSTATFSLPRQLIDQTYYMRFVTGTYKSRRSKVIRVVYPLVPTAPTGFLDTRDFLKPKVNLNLIGDIRNVYGIEVRSCMVSGASGVQFSGAQAANIESPLEILDRGVAGESSVNAASPTVSGAKIFHRTEFAFDPALYAPGTLFYFEAVVSNASFTESRSIYIQKQMIGRSNPVPVTVTTLSVPPQVFNMRIRFTQPFTGWQYESFVPLQDGQGPVIPSLEDQYKVIMQRQAEYTLNHTASAILPSADFSLHSLRLIAQQVGAKKTIIEIPMTSAGDVSASSVDATDYEFQIAGVNVAYSNPSTASVWLYNAAEWGGIASGRLFATMQVTGTNVTGSCILRDFNTNAVVADARILAARDGTDPVNVSATFTVSGLQDGHKYVVALGLSGGAGICRLYKARTWLVLNPLSKLNVYWRYGTLTSALNSGLSRINRILYSPQRNSSLTGLFLEGTGYGTSVYTMDGLSNGVFTDGDKTSYPGWFGYGTVSLNDHDHIPAQNWTVDKNFAPVVYQYNLVKTANALTIDYIETAKRAITQAAYQFELFASQVPGAFAPAGINDINNLRNLLLAGMNGDEAVLLAAHTGNVATLPLAAGSTLDVARATFALTALTQSHRYFAFVSSATDTTLFSDDFNRANGTLPAGNSLWTTDASQDPNNVVSNQARTGPNVAGNYVNNWPLSTSSVFVRITWITLTGVGLAGIAAMYTPGTPATRSCYLFKLGFDFSGFSYVLERKNAGANTVLATDTTTALTANDVFELRVVVNSGNVTLDVLRNSATLFHVVDTSGSRLTSGTVALLHEVADGVHTQTWDNFVAGQFAGGSGFIQALLVEQITGLTSSPDAEDAVTPIGNGQVLLQRTFKAPVDLIYEFDNTAYKVRQLCFRVFFFNLLWEYSTPALELSTYLAPPAVPLLEIVDITVGIITVRTDRINTRDTDSVEVQMASTSTFDGSVVRLKGGPLQSIYALQIPVELAGLFGQYIRARRRDYLGPSDWSEVLFISPGQLNNSTWNASPGSGEFTLTPSSPFSFITDATSITLTWVQFTVTYADGFVQALPAGSASFTGLTALTTYFIYVYLDGVRDATGVVRAVMSGVSGGTAEDPTLQATATQAGNLLLTGTVLQIETGSGHGTFGVLGGGYGLQDYRKLARLTTDSIASGGSEQGLVQIKKAFTVLSVETDHPVRLRLYATDAQRAADVSRPATVPPEAGTDHGVILDLVLDTADKFDWIMSPPANGANYEEPETPYIPYIVDNLDTVSQVINLEIYFLQTESDYDY